MDMLIKALFLMQLAYEQMLHLGRNRRACGGSRVPQPVFPYRYVLFLFPTMHAKEQRYQVHQTPRQRHPGRSIAGLASRI